MHPDLFLEGQTEMPDSFTYEYLSRQLSMAELTQDELLHLSQQLYDALDRQQREVLRAWQDTGL